MKCKMSNYWKSLVWVLFKQLYWDILQFMYHTVPLLILKLPAFKHLGCLCLGEVPVGCICECVSEWQGSFPSSEQQTVAILKCESVCNLTPIAHTYHVIKYKWIIKIIEDVLCKTDCFLSIGFTLTLVMLNWNIVWHL